VNQDGRIRVLIVDDHEMVRVGLTAMLQPEPDIEVVGQTGYGAAVVDLVEGTRPDVVLLDARLPDVSGGAVSEAGSQRVVSGPRCRLTYADGNSICIRDEIAVLFGT